MDEDRKAALAASLQREQELADYFKHWKGGNHPLARIADALERIAKALEDGLSLAAHIHVEPEHGHAPTEEAAQE